MIIIGGVGASWAPSWAPPSSCCCRSFSTTCCRAGVALHLPFTSATVSHIQLMVFGALIIFFLIVEPHGLARLWQIAKEKLRLWPFPH
jgi:branched-chain amino acid transport system permease protein